MPHSDLHAVRRRKNLTVAGLVVGFAALIFLVTILRM